MALSEAAILLIWSDHNPQGHAIPTKDENLKTRPLAEISGSIEKFHAFASVEDSTLCDFLLQNFWKVFEAYTMGIYQLRQGLKGGMGYGTLAVPAPLARVFSSTLLARRGEHLDQPTSRHHS